MQSSLQASALLFEYSDRNTCKAVITAVIPNRFYMQYKYIKIFHNSFDEKTRIRKCLTQ